MKKCWDDPTGFIEQFDQSRRSFISNLFCWGVRGRRWGNLDPDLATKDVQTVLKRVREECDERVASDHFTEQMRIDCNVLRDMLHSGLAKEYAEFIIEREHMEVGMKERLKAETAKTYVAKAMDAREPTLKQLNYLESLGFKGSTAGLSMAEVSKLIDVHKNR